MKFDDLWLPLRIHAQAIFRLVTVTILLLATPACGAPPAIQNQTNQPDLEPVTAAPFKVELMEAQLRAARIESILQRRQWDGIYAQTLHLRRTLEAATDLPACSARDPGVFDAGYAGLLSTLDRMLTAAQRDDWQKYGDLLQGLQALFQTLD